MSSQVIGNRDISGTPDVVRATAAENKRVRRGVAIAYAASALIVFVSILAQFITAGSALFAPAAAGWEASWQPHVAYGPTGILFGSILLIGLSFAARQPWRWTGAAALLLVLYFAQGLFIQLYETHDPILRLIAALHVLNAGVMFWLGFVLLGRGSDAVRSAFHSAR